MDILQRALGFIERLKQERSIAGIREVLDEATRHFGLSGFCLATMSDPAGRQAERIVGGDWHPDWLRPREDDDRIDVDAIAARLRTAREPFTWTELAAGTTVDPPADAGAEEARGSGPRTGFCVPIVAVGGDLVAVAFGGDRPELTEAEQSALHLIAIYAHSRASGLLAPSSEAGAYGLTPRERECLQWTAVGKTSWEIAQILNISQHTADWYIASAARKLKAVNRVQAVAEGLRRGLIH